MFNKDSLKFGLLLGAIAPLIGVIGMKFWKFQTFSWGEYLKGMLIFKEIITSVVVPSLVVNLILLTIFFNRKNDKSAKGVFIVTAIYASIMALMKFFG
jgi:uncharacterized membrane protein